MNPMLLSVPGEYIFIPREPRDVHQLFQHSADQLLHVFTEIGHTVRHAKNSCFLFTAGILLVCNQKDNRYVYSQVINVSDKHSK